jgi:hypothetical protein
LCTKIAKSLYCTLEPGAEISLELSQAIALSDFREETLSYSFKLFKED